MQNKKIFTEKQVDVSAFLTGPISPGILIFKNYMVLGKERQAYIALAATFTITICFFYALFQIPESVLDTVPSFIFTMFYGFIAAVFFRVFMAKDVDLAVESGAVTRSNWTVAGVSLVGLSANIAILLAFALNQPYFEGTAISVNGNELYYIAENVPEKDAHKVADILVAMEFFGLNYGNVAKLERSEEGYILIIAVDKQLWEDVEIMEFFAGLKEIMAVELNKHFDMKLESVSLSGKTEYLDI